MRLGEGRYRRYALEVEPSASPEESAISRDERKRAFASLCTAQGFGGQQIGERDRLKIDRVSAQALAANSKAANSKGLE